MIDKKVFIVEKSKDKEKSVTKRSRGLIQKIMYVRQYAIVNGAKE